MPAVGLLLKTTRGSGYGLAWGRGQAEIDIELGEVRGQIGFDRIEAVNEIGGGRGRQVEIADPCRDLHLDRLFIVTLQ